jgi:Leucine-rich repeat (LRR) protein
MRLMTSLTELNLCGNRLRSVPRVLGYLTNLLSLDLGQNDLHSLEDDFFSESDPLSRYLSPHFTPSLDEKKQLCRQTFVLGQLKNLQFLVLNNNHLRTVPDSIVQLSSLYKVTFAGNQLTYLPSTITQLPALKALSIWSNPWDMSLDSPPTRMEIPSLMELASLRVMSAQMPPEELRKGNDFSFSFHSDSFLFQRFLMN